MRFDARAEHASAKPHQQRIEDLLVLAPRDIRLEATFWHNQPFYIQAAMTANICQLLVCIDLHAIRICQKTYDALQIFIIANANVFVAGLMQDLASVKPSDVHLTSNRWLQTRLTLLGIEAGSARSQYE